MKAININPSKMQTKRVNDRADLKQQIWDVSLSSHPVTFADPTKVLKACKLKSCDLKSGAKAYSLFIPVFGTYFQTRWYCQNKIKAIWPTDSNEAQLIKVAPY